MTLGFCLLLALTASMAVNASPEDPWENKEFQDCYQKCSLLRSDLAYECEEGIKPNYVPGCKIDCQSQVFPENPIKPGVCKPGTYEYCHNNNCTVEEKTFYGEYFVCPKTDTGSDMYSNICHAKCHTNNYVKDAEYVLCKRKNANMNECRLCDPLPQ